MDGTFKKNEERDFKKECLKMTGGDCSANLSPSRSSQFFYEQLDQEISGRSPSNYSGKSFGSTGGSSKRLNMT